MSHNRLSARVIQTHSTRRDRHVSRAHCSEYTMQPRHITDLRQRWRYSPRCSPVQKTVAFLCASCAFADRLLEAYRSVKIAVHFSASGKCP